MCTGSNRRTPEVFCSGRRRGTTDGTKRRLSQVYWPQKGVITGVLAPKRVITGRLTPKRVITGVLTPKRIISCVLAPKRVITGVLTGWPQRGLSQVYWHQKGLLQVYWPQKGLSQVYWHQKERFTTCEHAPREGYHSCTDETGEIPQLYWCQKVLYL